MAIEDYQADVPNELTQKMIESRKWLRANKPRIHEKIMSYLEAEKAK